MECKKKTKQNNKKISFEHKIYGELFIAEELCITVQTLLYAYIPEVLSSASPRQEAVVFMMPKLVMCEQECQNTVHVQFVT